MTNLEALIKEKEERGRAYDELCRQADEQVRKYLDHVRRLEEEVVRLASKLADAEAVLAALKVRGKSDEQVEMLIDGMAHRVAYRLGMTGIEAIGDLKTALRGDEPLLPPGSMLTFHIWPADDANGDPT